MASQGYALGSDLLKEGYLKKEPIGKSGQWRTRWFVYRNDALFYYEDKPKPNEKAKGMFEIRSDTIVRTSAVQKPFAFEIYSKPVLLRVQASDKLESLAWQNLVKEQVMLIKQNLLEKGGAKELKMEGYLTKRPMLVTSTTNVLSWKRRYFVLKNSRITYFEEKPKGNNDKPKGIMELTADATVTILEEKPAMAKDKNVNKPNSFEVKAKKLTLTVSADTPQQMHEWIKALDDQILAKAGYVLPGAQQIGEFARSIGIPEYAQQMIASGCDELATLWDMDAKAEQKLTEDLELTRQEKDRFDEAWKKLKKLKKPESFKNKNAKVAKPKTVFFSMEPPPKGATTRLYTWGDGENGQLGLVAERAGEKVHTPTHVDALKGKSEPAYVACGSTAMAIITLSQDANAYTWGSGPIGLGADRLVSQRPFLVTALKDIPVCQIACGESHMICVSKSGDVFSWGGGDKGQLGLGDKKLGVGAPAMLDGVGTKSKILITACAAGPEHSVLISSTGQVYVFGSAQDFRLGLGSETAHQFTPTRVSALEGTPIGNVACGNSFTLAVSKNGSHAYWWGKVGKSAPKLPSPLATKRFTTRVISQCAAGGDVGMFLVGVERDEATGEISSDSSVYSFGSDKWVLGHGDDEVKDFPTLVEDLEGHGVRQIAVAPTHAGALTGDGRLLMWGSDDEGQLGSSYMVSTKRPSECIRISGFKYTYFAVGEGFSSAIAVEDKNANKEGNKPAGTPLPPPPPTEEALHAARTEEQELQGLLDQFAIFSHKYDLMNGEAQLPPPPAEEMPPPPPDDPPMVKMVKAGEKIGGKRVLPPGSTDIGKGWLKHTDKNTGKFYYEEEATKKVQWTAPF